MESNISPAVIGQLMTSVPAHLAGIGQPTFLGAGWDVEVYRWGNRVLRLPRRNQANAILDVEYDWIEPATRDLVEAGFSVSTPRYRGEPTKLFPHPWLVSDHVPGSPIHALPLGERGRAARDMALALAALHQPAPDTAPQNPYRNVPLHDKVPAFTHYAEKTNLPAFLHEAFDEAVSSAPWQGEKLWCHGDLHAGNILTHSGGLTGLIDFGDLGAGDPAVDYAVFYTVFTEQERADARVVLRSLGQPDDEGVWLRARGWAAHFTAALLSSSSPDDQTIAQQALILMELP